MSSPLKLFKECGGETAIATLGAFSAEKGPVTVSVRGMRAVVCVRSHKRFRYAEFAPMLVDFVADPERIAPQPPDCGARALRAAP